MNAPYIKSKKISTYGSVLAFALLFSSLCFSGVSFSDLKLIFYEKVLYAQNKQKEGTKQSIQWQKYLFDNTRYKNIFFEFCKTDAINFDDLVYLRCVLEGEIFSESENKFKKKSYKEVVRNKNNIAIGLIIFLLTSGKLAAILQQRELQPLLNKIYEKINTIRVKGVDIAPMMGCFDNDGFVELMRYLGEALNEEPLNTERIVATCIDATEAFLNMFPTMYYPDIDNIDRLTLKRTTPCIYTINNQTSTSKNLYIVWVNFLVKKVCERLKASTMKRMLNNGVFFPILQKSIRSMSLLFVELENSSIEQGYNLLYNLLEDDGRFFFLSKREQQNFLINKGFVICDDGYIRPIRVVQPRECVLCTRSSVLHPAKRKAFLIWI